MAKKFRHEGKTNNHTAAADVVSGEVVGLGASGQVGVAIADIASGAVGAVYRCGVWQFTAAAHGLAVGDDVLMTLATQVIGAGVSIGSVDEVVDANTIDVLINNLPGTASNA